MSDSNPEIDANIDRLAELCCKQLANDLESADTSDPTIENALRSLLMSGYARKERNLQTDIQQRVKDQCMDPAMHRGGALSGITAKWQAQFDKMAKWESTRPEEQTPSKAANISAATDA